MRVEFELSVNVFAGERAGYLCLPTTCKYPNWVLAVTVFIWHMYLPLSSSCTFAMCKNQVLCLSCLSCVTEIRGFLVITWLCTVNIADCSKCIQATCNDRTKKSKRSDINANAIFSTFYSFFSNEQKIWKGFALEASKQANLKLVGEGGCFRKSVVRRASGRNCLSKSPSGSIIFEFKIFRIPRHSLFALSVLAPSRILIFSHSLATPQSHFDSGWLLLDGIGKFLSFFLSRRRRRGANLCFIQYTLVAFKKGN